MAGPEPGSAGHFPGRAAIDAYGGGGFRFAEMSHRGSILCLPSGIWAWEAGTPADLDARAFARPIAEAAAFELLVVGTGPRLVPLAEGVRWALRDARLGIEVMATGPAVRTYNVLLGEGRRVGAALLAVD